MKVIANAGHAKYICEVNHHELEKFLGLYYNKLEALKIGDEISLAKGHDHARDTVEAMKTTRDFINSNKKIVEAIINGVRLESLVEPSVAPAKGDE
ncbi:MAG: hypothetical protein CML03_01015 [Pseudooceanicola sp.]|nr:hypothetical protein [Pseudooceanicola sp.]|tara:strand:- start:1646 stop:1933 length:288 start_codon:yes stop_codon:yes gene_type:complete